MLGWGVVTQAQDGWPIAAQGTIRVSIELDLPEAHLQGIIEKEPPQERSADPQDPLDRLRGLDDANDAGQDPQHADFVSVGDESRGRGNWKKTTVTGSVASME